MANWRELGEIPDSEDDEGFDSQPLDAEPMATAAALTDKYPDVWDFPDSPNSNSNVVTNPQPLESSIPEKEIDPEASSPLSSVLSEEGLPWVKHFFLGDDTQQDATVPGNGDAGRLGASRAESHHSFGVAQGLPLSSEPRFHSPSSSCEIELQSQTVGTVETSEAQRAAIRYERSLRPRKPIQEHPYLLENAQYSSVLKLHGVKPLRMAIENERRKRDAQPGISQEDEFQEESQESCDPEAPFDLCMGETRPSGDVDAPAFPSSTPPRLSPIGGLVGVSSPVTSHGGTDNTSVLDQDLPALEELLKKPPKLASTRASKRDATPFTSSTRKKTRRNIIESDQLEQDSVQLVSEIQSPSIQRSPSLRVPRPLPTSHDRVPSLSGCDRSPTLSAAGISGSAIGVNNCATFVSSGDEDLANETGSETINTTSPDSDGSVSENEAVTTMSRRIRGVLPASWLRLDQQAGRENAKKSLSRRTRIPRPSGTEHKRGVAQSLHATHGRASPPIFRDESDEETAPSTLDIDEKKVGHRGQLKLDFPELRIRGLDTKLEGDGDNSVEEDNEIHFMLSRPSRKRQLKLAGSLDQGAKKRPKRQDHATKQSFAKLRQVGIKAHLYESPSSSLFEYSHDQHIRKRESLHVSHKSTSKQARASPRKLSILDTIQPDAPQFLKIAARAARTRRLQGRSSPHKKIIQLATRQDQLDVASVLIDWRSGSIKQRDSVTKATKTFGKNQSRIVLAEASGNRDCDCTTGSQFRADVSRKLVKQVSNGGSVKYIPKQTATHPQRQNPKNTRKAVAVKKTLFPRSTRPAQLETDGSVQMTKFEFNTRKRILDHLFQNGHAGARKPRNEPSYLPGSARVPEIPMQNPAKQEADRFRKRVRGSRNRKRTAPQRIEINAPQYSHAKDPVHARYVVEPTLAVAEPAQAKFVGLGPYGTQYTHHFEIFPLPPDAFFHESSLIGSGELQSCATVSFSTNGSETQPCMALSLNNHLFRWGPWNDQTSSELGVVLDYIAEGVETRLARKSDPSPNELSPVLAASFVLGYVKSSLGYLRQNQRQSFVSRARECLESLNHRTDCLVTTVHLSTHSVRRVLETYDRLLLIVFLILRFCSEDASLIAEKFSVEISVQRLGATVIGILTEVGFGNLQELYEELNTKRFREGGIRSDNTIIHSWVMVMKVLELAHIPRTSFWDVAHSRISPKQHLCSNNAQDHERVWENVFTLLPLVEFSTIGVLVAGQRHRVPSDGWVVPQKLLRQVFQLYQRDPRQAASFNNYCRALVGRCHHLVQEWGWQRCTSIIGLIFDFFGSQQLAHLRNEEVFKSPRFLDDLGGRPNLAIEPEDRCFHVFLKLVAVAIRKLRAAGSIKDISNLVTRIMPNHDRQHRKDENVHARDLAALRNHHDLLCTLFWAAPAECRPSPILIQNLVDPADSHKEACLINLRAWTQLARFVISSGEANISWKPLHAWRNSFFEQVLKQFNSVASEVALQISTLGKEASDSITGEMINAAVSVNKAALIDVLYASLAASLHVIQHAPDLLTATFSWNTKQLRTIFDQFSMTPDLSWGLLRVSLSTLETMLSEIDDCKAREESQESVNQIPNAAVADNALQALDKDLSEKFFGMARRVLAIPLNEQDSHLRQQERAQCTEQIVILAARMSTRFINGGSMRLSGAFQGSYRLFSESPFKLDLRQRRYMVLYISTLLRYGINDFDDAGFRLCDVWVSSLAKPRTSLQYEIELGKELRRHGEILVPDTVVEISTQPDYNTNRDLLEYAFSTMRKAVRDAEPTLRAARMTEYSSSLKLMMDQIKNDVKNDTQTSKEHDGYVVFVQDVISLVKTHVSDICAVNDYFYQISNEYQPSAEDPQLKVANLKSYGLRLQDGDARIGQSLFHLLFNNAKFSIFNDKLREEVDMLGKGMANTGVKIFIMSKMLPSIIYASFKETDAFPLLDIYVEAIALRLRGKTVPLELFADDAPAICALLQAMLNGIKGLFKGEGVLTGSQIHVMNQVVGLGNLLWASIHVLSMSNSQPPFWTMLWSLLCDLWGVISRWHARLQSSNGQELSVDIAGFESLPTCPREARSQANGCDSDVANFAENIVQDVRKNWKVTEDSIAIRMPGQKQGAAQGPPVAYAGWKTESLVDELYNEIQEWNWWWRKANGLSSLPNPENEVF
ncbi:Methyl methanesulfonate-sensitivity protein 22 [Metarhizium album ARSEF 1941]|uniref:Methyl methanesulfonate-sensitivity protein 22 n=1 Tax=Metarhizium album (strain ARSEF 1941) TaxID=1081103 RepID=A0A0B2WWM3_METAS|nr:Methyl methanesulfonate-sensitivity protein 22 [Metarhizium album ARSEF 1941]KHN97817.1 Methyl methanesulfonate-sensitivity protein 22 [Metarhizium album ARSEF 1941]